MSRFNTRSSGIKTTNLAGGKAYSMNPEMELIHAVLTTFLDEKYYESANDRIERIKKLISQNNHEFVAKLAYVTRTEFNLRSVSHLLLGELALIHKGDNLVSKTIEKTIQRVDDITELVAYLDSKLSNQVKKGIRRSLYKFSRYQLAKYKGENNSVKLVDVFNMVHPKPQFATEEQRQAWQDLLTGKLKSFDTWESEIKSDTKKETWERLVKEDKLGYMALLRNLNNLIKNDVDSETIELAYKKLTDVEEVKKSKQLPFRFMTAYKNVQGNRKLTDAISIAIEHALSNTPELAGKTLIAIDGSGSMGGDPIEKASIFGATLAKVNKDADVILYDTQVQELQLSSRTPTIDIAESIMRSAHGGGTQTSLVFQYAYIKKKAYDRIIIISDNQSWQESSFYNNGVQAFYEGYKKELNVDPFVYAIDIQGYGTTDLTGGKVFHLTGWSDRLLDFIGKAEEGYNLVDYIKSITII